MSIDAGDALVRALHDHNPWWEHGTEAFSLPARQKSDFYHLARPDESDSQFEDQPLLGLVGRRGVGKPRSSISSFTIASRPVMIQNDSSISPSTPIRSTNSNRTNSYGVQFRYYESRILGRIEADHPHFILIDDVHQIEHPNKPTIDGWGVPVAELLKDVRDDTSS